jgi:signal transduction histidine kinase
VGAVRSWPEVVPGTVRARAGDVACIVAALVVGGLATDATSVPTSSYAEVNDLVGLVAALALWWRRRHVVAVAALTFVAAAAAPLAQGASVLAVFSLAAHHRGRIPLPLVGLGVVTAVVGMVAFPDEDAGMVFSLAVGALLILTAVGWGLALRSRRELLASLAERAERAESDQRARIAEARRAERTRIATEMHDVLAHRLSMLSLHAGAVELRPAAPPEDLARAAAVVRASAHQALEELRTVIGVLRQEDLAEASPAPADLAALVEESRAAGTRIEVVDGAVGDGAAGDSGAGVRPGDGGDGVRPGAGSLPSVDGAALPDDLARHVYRIVQEGLTNARKHAPGAPVRLSVSGRAGEGVCVEITNPIRNATGATLAAAIPGAGVGLVGVRERVELLGGAFERRTDDAGTHRLRVWLPWPA